MLRYKTWAGKSKAAVGNHYCCRECLDIHLLKAHRAVANPLLGLVPCADDTRQEWVINSYSTAHPILRWLSSKLAVWLAENLGQELNSSQTWEEVDDGGVEHDPCEQHLVISGPNSRHLRSQDCWCYSMGVQAEQRKPQEGRRLAVIHSIWMGIVSRERTPR